VFIHELETANRIAAISAAMRFAVSSSWMNTYWGGAVAAVGGALVLGALERIARGRRLTLNALLLGLGLAILSQSRPYEGAFFAVPLVIGLALWLRRQEGIRVREIVLPLAASILVILVGLGYYNWRVTGNALLFPPALQQKVYGMPQSFWWQRPILSAPRASHYKEIADTFRWQLKTYRTGLTWEVAGKRLLLFWRFFLQPVLSIPLLVLVWRSKKKRLWWLAGSIVAILAANFMYPFFFPHYVAPAYPALLLLSVVGLRTLRTMRCFGRASGALLARWIVVSTMLSASAVAVGAMLLPSAVMTAESPRGWVIDKLEKQGGSHLVLVRYNKDHSLDYPIVYNRADVDRSSTVWAHTVDPKYDQELIDYYKTRRVWVFNPDHYPFALFPFRDAFVSSVTNASGWRDDRVQGVSPGGIAVILGANFIDGGDCVLESRNVLHGLPFRLAEASENHGDVFEPALSNRTAMDGSRPLPLQLGHVSAMFNGIPAPLFSISKIRSEEAITVQVPQEVQVGSAMVVVHAGKRSATAKVTILPATPGILETERSDSSRQAIILRTDGSPVDLAHPARRGESLRCLVTGLGPLTPAIATNHTGPQSPSIVPNFIVVGIDSSPVPFLYARSAPGLIGVEEIGFQVPMNAKAGLAETFAISVTVGGKRVFGNSSWIPIQSREVTK